jgi:tetratricopeptide (TPR) repeat protein
MCNYELKNPKSHQITRPDGRIPVINCGRALIGLALAITYLWSGAAAAQSAREQLNQLVQQLQSKPDDNRLREQIIKLAITIKPPPAIPENARKSFIEGSTIAKAATDASGQAIAIASFKEALKIAPWWGDAYYNLAAAQELAGQLDNAEASLKLYILTGPSDKDSREAQDHVYALEGKKKLAAQAQSVKAVPETADHAYGDIVQSLQGHWNFDGLFSLYARLSPDSGRGSGIAHVTITGKEILIRREGSTFTVLKGTITGNDLSSIQWFVHSVDPGHYVPAPDYPIKVTIDKNGSHIYWKEPWPAVKDGNNIWSTDDYVEVNLTR